MTFELGIVLGWIGGTVFSGGVFMIVEYWERYMQK